MFTQILILIKQENNSNGWYCMKNIIVLYILFRLRVLFKLPSNVV